MSSPISGFTAIPNPQMLAFMPIQSYLMMYFAGSGWQYGKRKISAMSNEQFNKLTPEDLLAQHSIELKNMLPTLNKTLNDVTPLVKTLIIQYGDFIKEALHAIGPAIEALLKPTNAQDIYNSQFGITPIRYDPGPQFEKLGKASPEDIAKIQKALDDAIASLGYTPGTQTTLGPGYIPPNRLPGKDPKLTQEEFKQTFGLQKDPIVHEKPGGRRKRPAGQSQFMERFRLIQFIAKKAQEMRAVKSGRTQSSRIIIKNLTRQWNDAKGALHTLLTRYEFKTSSRYNIKYKITKTGKVAKF